MRTFLSAESVSSLREIYSSPIIREADLGILGPGVVLKK
jgi:hypothetical protein